MRTTAPRGLALTLLATALHAAPAVLRAQQHPVTVPEIRIDATSSHAPRLELSGGAIIPIGNYVRLALTAGGGVAREDRLTRKVGRADAIVRFELDPLKQHSRGFYLGSGLSLLGRDGPHVRGYLALVAGLELRARGGWVPSVEAGLGGGARFAVSARRAMQLWR